MSYQLLLNLSAVVVGFLAAICFCVGNVLNTPKTIWQIAKPRWDFSPELARSFASQRAQYAVGALLLVLTFVFQMASMVASTSALAPLPMWLCSWQTFAGVVFVLGAVFASSAIWSLYRLTMRRVLHLEEAAQSEQSAAQRSA